MVIPYFYGALVWLTLFPTRTHGTRNNEGTEFILTFIQQYRNKHDMKAYVTTLSIVEYTVTATTFKHDTSWNETQFAVRGAPVIFTIDKELRTIGPAKVFKCVHIQSTGEVTVYAVDSEPFSTDAYLALPIAFLGETYYLIQYATSGQFSVTATTENTIVTPFGDMTGTLIESNYPVVVVSGNHQLSINSQPGTKVYSGSLPAPKRNNRTVNSDVVSEMLFPLENWGKEYIVFSTPDRYGGDIVRVLVSTRETHILIAQGENMTRSKVLLPSRGWHDMDVSTGNPLSLQSNNIFCVAIFAKSFVFGADKEELGGDPSFTLIPPVPLYKSDYVFRTVDFFSRSGVRHTITLAIRAGDEIYLRHNNRRINLQWVKVSFANFLVGWLSIAEGLHNIYSLRPEKSFMAIASGVGMYTSYSFPLGQRLTNIYRTVEECREEQAALGATTKRPVMTTVAQRPIETNENKSVDTPTAAFKRSITGEKKWKYDVGEKPLTEPTLTTDSVGDDLDNDCDGSVDEERLDLRDNDSDGLVDEDLAKSERRNGHWGSWGKFTRCGKKARCERQRFRLCDKPKPLANGLPCIGTAEDTQHCQELQECKKCIHGETVWGFTGNKTCSCYSSWELGSWKSRYCEKCHEQYEGRECKDCRFGWVGYGHCLIPCESYQYRGWDNDGGRHDRPIVPKFTCLRQISQSYGMAWFGYSSFNDKTEKIGIGPDNQVTKTLASSQQETLFRPGLHAYSFQVGPFRIGQHVAWRLLFKSGGSDYTVTVPANMSLVCPPTARKYEFPDYDINQILGFCKCRRGRFGASCSEICPGGEFSPCSRRGVCSKMKGVCLCSSRSVGEFYFLGSYTEGFRGKEDDYLCQDCTTDFYGKDCSTGHLSREVMGSNHYAVAASSEIITLDGASLTSASYGAFRLLETATFILDAFFVPCKGRHDCRTINEAALKYGEETVSIAVDIHGHTIVELMSGVSTEPPFLLKRGELTISRSTRDVVRFDFADLTEVLVANVEGEMLVGVTMSPLTANVSGLFGTPDGNWINDVWDLRPIRRMNAKDKAKLADKRHKLATSTVLLSTTIKVNHDRQSGCFALVVEAGSPGAFVSDLHLPPLVEFSIEFWSEVPVVEGKIAVLVNMKTSLGDFVISVINKRIAVDWGSYKLYASSVADRSTSWTYTSINWKSTSGTLLVREAAMKKTKTVGWTQLTPSMHESYGIHKGKLLEKIWSIRFSNPASDTVIAYDYFRIFDVTRTPISIAFDFRTYTRKKKRNEILKILFDQGSGPTFEVDIGETTKVEGHINDGARWIYSEVPVHKVVDVELIPPIVRDKEAVLACSRELDSPLFRRECEAFGAVYQIFKENCIRDYMRTKNPGMVKLSGSAYALYCQGVLGLSKCRFGTYLDFCRFTADQFFQALTTILGAVFFTLMLSGVNYFFCITRSRKSVAVRMIATQMTLNDSRSAKSKRGNMSSSPSRSTHSNVF